MMRSSADRRFLRLTASADDMPRVERAVVVVRVSSTSDLKITGRMLIK